MSNCLTAYSNTKKPLRQEQRATSLREKFREIKDHYICITIWLREIAARISNTNVRLQYFILYNWRAYEF